MIQKMYGKKREKKESPPKKNESRLQVSTKGRGALGRAGTSIPTRPIPAKLNLGEVRPVAQL